VGRSAAPLKVSDVQHTVLQAVARSATTPPRQLRRVRALLLAADGLSNEEVARTCQVTPHTVSTWREQFASQGLASLWGKRILGSRRVEVDPCPEEPSLVLGGLYLGRAERAVAAWARGADTGSATVLEDGRAYNARDFLLFLKTVDGCARRDVDVRIIVDGATSYDVHEVDVWLAHPKRRRFHLHRAPQPSAWTQLIARLNGRGGSPSREAATATVASFVSRAAPPVGQWVIDRSR